MKEVKSSIHYILVANENVALPDTKFQQALRRRTAKSLMSPCANRTAAKKLQTCQSMMIRSRLSASTRTANPKYLNLTLDPTLRHHSPHHRVFGFWFLVFGFWFLAFQCPFGFQSLLFHSICDDLDDLDTYTKHVFQCNPGP